MLNDNFYRGSGITLAIKRLLNTPAFEGLEVYLAGCEWLAGKESVQEDASLVDCERYRCFALMSDGAGLIGGLYEFVRWVLSMRIDVIHVHHRRLAVLANLVRPLTRVPVLFTGHLTFAEASWFRGLSPKVMTGVSPSVVEYLRRCTNVKTISVVYNPVDFPLRQTGSKRFGSRRVVTVGRLEEVKGHDTLITAWSMLRRRGVKATLDIFGEGSLRDRLVGQIREEGLEDFIVLCGFAGDIPERLADYSFNVLVSEREGFPNSVVEAAASGLPTLLTSVDGSRDAIPPHLLLPNGLRFGDASQLSEALERWLDSPDLLQADGENFYDYLKIRCSPEVVGPQYLDVYSALQRG